MQTFFLATDKCTGEAWVYSARPIGCEGSFLAGDGVRSRKWFFQRDAPPPGECWEYRLVRVGEADDKDARIAELEKAVANAENRCVIAGESVKALESKLRGVEDCARELRQRVAERDNQLALARGDCEVLRKGLANQKDLGAKGYSVAEELQAKLRDLETKLKNAETYGVAMADDNRGLRERIAEMEKQLAERSPGVMPAPEGHEWQPVDDANPITSADVGRMFCWGPTRIEHVFGNGPKFQAAIEGRHILRPVAPPFVFDGTDGEYKTDSGEIADVLTVKDGKLIALIGERVVRVARHGTFPGGRIVGRVGE